ncbi:hypothetical protein C8K18_101806 [Paraburkholderia sp. GV068]|uniref:hypothetical protein n=1 Tax=unclassified Paraburkholderia TaxID=2615204 RepID=UPI000D32449B|nr:MULTISPECIES: hypothetical protein [unclassified Paraburkholderia]PTR04326.1 hypothetical protein C8K19_101731 [Paraburkholderia sp. GV072]PUB09283.1 hypothetical protein C8K18_101806 [Paraburkholderia sp. GV068]
MKATNKATTRSVKPPTRRVSRSMPVQPLATVQVRPRTLKASPKREVSDALHALREELRDAEAYWTRQYRWVAEVKRMTPEQIMRAWQVAEDWQLRSLALQALEVDPLLRLELTLFKETGGKGADGEYSPPSETLAQVLAVMVDKHPVRHPCVISRDILNVKNGLAA